ncbi:MAG: efflux RND transporter permease subunit [Saprospiraceae bacterium]|nr:efflux RND transporter permease subunit [Saprospiraceae bacterium]
MIKTFINRPVLSAVVSILIVILGILGLINLPITQYPEIAPPTVSINTNYPGANAETVMRSVIIPIEEQVNGVENMIYITSSASNDGSANIQVFFEQGTDPDIAAVNVQNRVARATPLLPAEVTRSGVVTQKQQSSALMYLSFYSTNPIYDDIFLQNYLNINVVPEIKRIKGVGDANAFGGKTYAMRIWLKPDKMAAYGLMPTDVTSSINEQSREAAAGFLGSNSGSSFEYVIRYKGKYDKVQEYEDIVIKSLGNGQFLRLKDVAEIQLDALSYSGVGENNGYPAMSMGIFQTPGSNAREINNNIKAYLKEVEKSLPEGISYTINFDTNEFLEASISKVITTLIEAFILVFIVVFIFLQDFRSTLIPAIAVPVSIIGTFFFLNLFGYSLNLLTLFALVLAIGIVVDDAIVVVEAVHAKLEKGEKDSKAATVSAMSEITGAIISITLVMASVFIPVTFLKGPTGVFYQQFGITLIVAIAISAVNALSLSPMLCALFLKGNHEDESYANKNFIQKFFHKFDAAFHATTTRYGMLVSYIIRNKWLVGVGLVLAVLIMLWSNNTMPKGFVPTEDRGIIFTNVELPPGASMERTYNVMREIEKTVNQLPGIKGMTISTGRSFFSGTGSNNGLGFIRMKPFDERKKDPNLSFDKIVKSLYKAVSGIADAQIIFFTPPSVPGFGANAGFEIVLLDKGGHEISEVDEVSKEFLSDLMQRPEIQFAQSPFNTKFPQYEMVINVERAEETGVSVASILSVMQGYIGGIYTTDFSKYGKQYRVMVQSLPESRMDVNSLSQLYVRTSSGKMTPVSQFVTLKRVFGPQSINRYNLFTSVKVTGANAQGYSTGDAINAVNEVAAKALPSDYGIDYTGLTREEVKAGSQAIIIFLLSLIFVYFLLAAQYDSFVQPLSIILSLPFGVMGAFLGQKLAGLENNIYFQIALIMLVGLLAKNAILIVEFALQRRRHGESIGMSAVNAAKARLRPILMTSFAFIFGMLPLVLATGIGATGNRSIGTGAASGLLVGTVLGVLAVPVFYVIFQYIQEKITPVVFENKENVQS